jgi:phi13 family phage major tail protein
MSAIGLKYPVFAALTETGTTASYSGGAVLGKAISVSSSISTSDVKLYADDGISEIDNSFLNGTITVGFDHITDAIKTALLNYTEGAEVDAVTGAKELSAGSSTVIPYVGFGFYGKSIKTNVNYWRAVWLKKVLFKEPNEDLATKGETTEFKTPVLEGTITMACDSKWKEEGTFSTEAGAIAWLNTKSGISSAVSTGLTNLSISNCTLTPAFAAAKFNYSGTATNNVAVTATAAGVIKLYVDGLYNQTLTTTVAGVAVTMGAGDNKLFEIVITESGKAPITTRIMMHRA